MNKARRKKIQEALELLQQATEILAQVGDEEEEAFDNIKIKTFSFKPMSVEEAILQMNLIGHDFYVFKDAETLETCVVYKRHLGGYGLIVPEI
jgi:putative sigma-54 modulation protein